MRTLRLTENQIELIKLSLGMSEKKFADIYSDIAQKTILVRGNDLETEHRLAAHFYHEKSCQLADLCTLIANGELDA